MEFWFRRHYNLAPTDPRFLDLTSEQLQVEYWAWHYHLNPPSEEFEDEEFNRDAILKDMEENPDNWDPV